jgi:dihydrofolate synthase/folylpolyglutamate synthase
MTYEQALNKIHSALRFGSKPGLERTKELLKRLGNPERRLRFIHISGTNGKGSTAAMMAAALEESGYKTGLYTSPALENFRERMMINGRMIAPAELADRFTEVDRQLSAMRSDGLDHPTEFELVTALALCWFEREQCDIVVLEAGLGGRFDATNVIPAPEVSVITALSYDHTEVLGDTMEQISFEKCGIIKRGGVAVSYPIQPDKGPDFIRRNAAQKGATLVVPDLSKLSVLEEGLEGSRFLYDNEEYSISIVGRHQIYNAITALTALQCLAEKGIPLKEDAVKVGLSRAFLPGRFELVSKNPRIILDGAHNRDGVDSLAALIDKYICGRLVVVMGMLHDKEYRYGIREISRRADLFIATQPDSPRALAASGAAAVARDFCGEVRECADIGAALKEAKNSSDENTTVLVCGSLYLIGPARALIFGRESEIY